MKNVIDFTLEGLNLSTKEKIRYESIHKGLESLNKDQIVEALQNLREAADLAVKSNEFLVFYGD